ncbi:MAG: HAMP domain-containing histidine kinase [Verrucomicrobia bacterium]|nr:HAMP domain-containing histidine kinase [Verrucomicrobiota bacterium]
MPDKRNILIIDDEEVVLDSCTQVLEGAEYRLATAANGTLGLNLLLQFQPDLVFVDLKMPGISGFQVLQRIQEFDPTVVAVVITGYATVSSAVEAMKKGAYDFLPKPFTPEELRLITSRALEKRRLVLEAMALRREKEMLRENFAAIVSHELKAPLGAVQQNLFALAAELSGQLTESQRGRLERMKARLGDLLKLIETWLRVISVDFTKLQESFKPVALAPVIAKAIESVQPQAVRKEIGISASIPEGLPLISGHEGSLTEALVNLLGNAVKYSRPGGEVSLKAEEREDSILLSVADTGIGISKEDLPLIFRDFYRGRSGQDAEMGCGLGLPITRGIVEAHHGAISVESEPGKGSRFVIRLPLLRDHGAVFAAAETALANCD